MTEVGPAIPKGDAELPPRLSPNVAVLGCVNMLTAISSAMIYGLLPVFLVRVLEAGTAFVVWTLVIPRSRFIIEGRLAAPHSAGAARHRCGH